MRFPFSAKVNFDYRQDKKLQSAYVKFGHTVVFPDTKG